MNKRAVVGTRSRHTRIALVAVAGALVGGVVAGMFGQTQQSLVADCLSCATDWKATMFGVELMRGSGSYPYPDWIFALSGALVER